MDPVRVANYWREMNPTEMGEWWGCRLLWATAAAKYGRDLMLPHRELIDVRMT